MDSYALLLLVLLNVVTVDEGVATDITEDIKLNVEGLIAAYGDFNSDKATDIFIVSQTWTVVNLYVWNTQKQHFILSKDVKITVSKPEYIVGIALADFDGDGYMDVLLTTKMTDDKTKRTYVNIYYGDSKILKKGNLDAKMADQPTILDVNGDLLPDLFGTSTDTSERTYWISVPADGSKERHFTSVSQPSNTAMLTVPNSNAFVDVTSDMHPDLVVQSKNDVHGDLMLEVWQQEEGNRNLSLTDDVFILPPFKHLGQMSFADIDGDGKIDLIIPVCLTDSCSKSVVYIKSQVDGKLKKGNWSVLMNNDNSNWQFDVDDMKGSKLPFMIRFGDFTLDGMIDGVAILQIKNGQKSAARLVNSKCIYHKNLGCQGKRTLDVQWFEDSPEDAVAISLMDVGENGALDFMITCRNKASKPSKEIYLTKVLRNNYNVDTAFLKVAVVSGTKSTAQYGSNQIGAMVEMSTTNTDGDKIKQTAVQWSQSSYFALQLPYVVFGLGHSPNFVDKITVGVAKGPQKVNREKSWTAIIPNAQVIVIPYPKDSPSQWVTKLLVTPSKLLLQTGGVLVGTCLLIAGVILILHIKEKKEDEREKRAESHKFHFDAL